MKHPYLESLQAAEDAEERINESDNPGQVIRGMRKELDEIEQGLERGASADAPDPSNGQDATTDLSDAKKAAKRALPPSETEVTRRTVGTNPSAMAAFSKNLPDGMTPEEGLDNLE